MRVCCFERIDDMAGYPVVNAWPAAETVGGIQQVDWSSEDSVWRPVTQKHFEELRLIVYAARHYLGDQAEFVALQSSLDSRTPCAVVAQLDDMVVVVAVDPDVVSAMLLANCESIRRIVEDGASDAVSDAGACRYAVSWVEITMTQICELSKHL